MSARTSLKSYKAVMAGKNAATYYAKNKEARTAAYIAARKSGMLAAPSIPASRFTSYGTEYKALDTVLSASAAAPTSGAALLFNPTGTITCLNLIQAGSSFYNRVGRKIHLVSLEAKFRINFIPGASLTVPDNLLRILFIYDSAPNGAYPSIPDILQDTDQLGNNQTTVFSGINLNYRDRFQVIRDIRVETPSLSTDASSNVVAGTPADQVSFTPFLHEFSKKINNHDQCFRAESNPAVMGDISTGAIYCLCISFVSTTAWQISGTTRLRFKDP